MLGRPSPELLQVGRRQTTGEAISTVAAVFIRMVAPHAPLLAMSLQAASTAARAAEHFKR
jgi:hypothetical protein